MGVIERSVRKQVSPSSMLAGYVLTVRQGRSDARAGGTMAPWLRGSRDGWRW
jgi:hypothetical protein